ncbi:tetratricopeptide repeat protein [Capnocytophaga catalasegens]|nr:tetratricopeptide repeat protein [Capnocytophaga catalasegens]
MIFLIRKYSFTFLLFWAMSWQASAQEEKIVRQVSQHFSKKEYDSAKKLLDKALIESPNDADLLALLGIYYYQKQMYDKARFNLLKSIEINPTNEEAKQVLTNIEIATKNYSSAICYINELLEISPYDPELWRKKIAVYREQGNDIEALRLLKRVRIIYPQDEQFKKDYLYSLQELSVQEKKKGNIDQAVKMDEETIKINPKDEQGYVRLINNYLMAGDREKALLYVNRGLENLPHNKNLVNRKIGILTEMNRYVEAVDFIQKEMKKGNVSSEMVLNYNDILSQAAQYQNQNDPYVLYGKLFENNPLNNEALDYLISNSISKGYYQEALVYIDKGMLLKGRTKELLVKKYLVYKLLNREGQAINLLEELYKEYPTDIDIKNDYLQYRYQRGKELAQEAMCDEAIIDFEFVAYQNDNEWQENAMKSLFNCYFQKKKYDKALQIAEVLGQKYPQEGEVKKAAIYHVQGEYEKALAIYNKLIETQKNEKFVDGYEEIAIEYIKQLNAAGNTIKAYEQSKKLVELKPTSNQGLKYLIVVASTLNKSDEALSYIKKGAELYPHDLFFVIKQAQEYTKNDNPDKAITFLDPYLEKYPHNQDLVRAYSEAVQKQAQHLSRQNQLDLAQDLLRKATKYDPKNNELNYQHGLIFEKQHQYDSAYVYQRKYQPSVLEISEFRKQLNWLKHKLYRNEARFMYQRNDIDDKRIPGIFEASYVRYANKNTYTLGLTSSGRTDKRAYMVQGEWAHTLSPKWYFTIGGGASGHFFPKYIGNMTIYRTLPRDWEAELSVGYKELRSVDASQLFQLQVGATKHLDRFRLNAKLVGISLASQFYYNTLGRIQYNLDNERTFLAIYGGIGSAPVDEILNYQYYSSFSTTNANFGGIAQYMLSDIITLGISGTWYEYTDSIDRSNLYNLSFYLNVSF